VTVVVVALGRGGACYEDLWGDDVDDDDDVSG
jgi:hypothetical protein